MTRPYRSCSEIIFNCSKIIFRIYMLVHHGLLYNRIFLYLYFLFPRFRTKYLAHSTLRNSHTVVNVTQHLASLRPWTNPSPPLPPIIILHIHVYVHINVPAFLPQANVGYLNCLWGNMMNSLKVLQVYS